MASIAIVLLFVCTPPATAHVPRPCEYQLDQLGTYYGEREAKRTEIKGFASRFNDKKSRAASVTKLEMAELLADFFLWAGDYVTHGGTTAAAMSSLLGCIQSEG